MFPAQHSILCLVVVCFLSFFVSFAHSSDGVRVHVNRCQHDALLHQASFHDFLSTQSQLYNSEEDNSRPLRMVLSNQSTISSAMQSHNNEMSTTTRRNLFCEEEGDIVIDPFLGTNVTCRAVDVLTEGKRRMLFELAAPNAMAMYTARLRVRPVVGNLTIGSTHNETTTTTCGGYELPLSDVQYGVADADMVVYVSTVPPASLRSNAVNETLNDEISDHDAVRVAICQVDQYHRPTVAVLNVAPSVLSHLPLHYYDNNNSNTASTTDSIGNCVYGTYGDYAVDTLTRAIAHGLTHALGFSFPFMTNSSQMNSSSFTPIMTEFGERRGKQVLLVTSPNTTRTADAHFNCTMHHSHGVELEDQDPRSGSIVLQGNDSIGSSHWEARNHRGELMVASSLIYVIDAQSEEEASVLSALCVQTDHHSNSSMNGTTVPTLSSSTLPNATQRLSNLTLHLLQDLNLYATVKIEESEFILFAKDIGCSFLNEPCNVSSSNVVTDNLYCMPSPTTTYNPQRQEVQWCTEDRLAIATCATKEYHSSTPIADVFQYFPLDPQRGGLDNLEDYCPSPDPTWWCSSPQQHHNNNNSSNSNTQDILATGGFADSRCLSYLDLSTPPPASSEDDGSSSALSTAAWDGVLCSRMRCVVTADPNNNVENYNEGLTLEFQLRGQQQQEREDNQEEDGGNNGTQWFACPISAPNSTSVVPVSVPNVNGSTLLLLILCPSHIDALCRSLPLVNRSIAPSPPPSTTTAAPNSTTPVPLTPSPSNATTTVAPTPNPISLSVRFIVRIAGDGWGPLLQRIANSTNGTVALFELRSLLRQMFLDATRNVTSDSSVEVTSLTAGSLVVEYTLENATGAATNPAEAAAVAASLMSANVTDLGGFYEQETGLPASSIVVLSAVVVPPTAPAPADDSSGCDTTCVIIVASVLGGVIVLILIVVLLCCCCKKNQKRDDDAAAQQTTRQNTLRHPNNDDDNDCNSIALQFYEKDDDLAPLDPVMMNRFERTPRSFGKYNTMGADADAGDRDTPPPFDQFQNHSRLRHI